MAPNTQNELRKLPAIDRLMQIPQVAGWIEVYGRELVVDAAREALDSLRGNILDGHSYPGEEGVIARVEKCLTAIVQPTLHPAIYATGVILHRNLGRAPLSKEVIAAMRRIGEGYSNLEFDLAWIALVMLGRRDFPFLPMPSRYRGIAALLELLNPTYRFDILSLEDPRPGLAEILKIVRKFGTELKEGM